MVIMICIFVLFGSIHYSYLAFHPQFNIQYQSCCRVHQFQEASNVSQSMRHHRDIV